MREVSFRYGPHAPMALRRVSLVIEPGEALALAGATGAGKRTLAALLAGRLVPCEGEMRCDGQAPRWRRGRIGFAAREPALFHGTIGENIVFGIPGASRERAIEAARRACLHEDILRLPGGYDARIGSVEEEDGVDLSPSQRQRLGIARALVGRPAVLVLEEGPGGLDSRTEAALARSLSSLGCTRIHVIARPRDLLGQGLGQGLGRGIDRVLLLREGRLVGDGAPSALAASSAYFRNLLSGVMAAPAENNAVQGKGGDPWRRTRDMIF